MYFIYPETCGVRLEDMDSLFGDATTAMGTPSIHAAETGSLMGPGSPMGSGRGIGPSSAIPGLALDPPDIDDDNKSFQTSSGEDRSVRGWLSRVVGRGRGDSPSSSSQGRYAPIGQDEERNRNDN